MPDLLRITAVFILIIVLLRRKIDIGYVMLLASAALALSYLMRPTAMLASVTSTLLDPVTLKLGIALTSIRAFEMVLREKKVLAEMMSFSKSVLRDRRAVIVSMPLLIGMLPSVGGAYFSAPMVDESTAGLPLTQEDKGFFNYWYRHPWEYVLPLYPGIVLASAVADIEIWGLIAYNFSSAFMLVLSGVFLGLGKVSNRFAHTGGVSMRGLLSFVPIIAALLLVVVLRVQLHWSILLCVAGLLIFYRYPLLEIRKVLKHALNPGIIVLIIGVMLFKHVMEASGAVQNISAYLTLKGIPIAPMLFLLPFITGLLTGLAVGFVGSTFPLLLSLEGGSSLHAISFAFASGFIGVLLSPVHVCLILTREYFRADMWGMYKKIIPAGAMVLAAAAVQYFVFSALI